MGYLYQPAERADTHRVEVTPRSRGPELIQGCLCIHDLIEFLQDVAPLRIRQKGGFERVACEVGKLFFRQIKSLLNRDEVLIDVAAEVGRIVGVDRDAKFRVEQLWK